MALADDGPLFSQLPHKQAVKQAINPGADKTLGGLVKHKVMSPCTLPTRSYLPPLRNNTRDDSTLGPDSHAFDKGGAFGNGSL